MELDLSGTVNGIRKNLVTFVKSSLLPTELKPNISINENTLKIALAEVVQRNTNLPINATLTTQSGKVVSTEAVNGTEIDLSPTEYKLLRFLMANANRVMSKDQILDHVWEYDFNGEQGIVESYVSYLRKKIDPLSKNQLIQTKRGVGYIFRVAKSEE
jgi:DNA-binding winged helix-turn-helix (wHTH) protein